MEERYMLRGILRWMVEAAIVLLPNTRCSRLAFVGAMLRTLLAETAVQSSTSGGVAGALPAEVEQALTA